MTCRLQGASAQHFPSIHSITPTTPFFAICRYCFRQADALSESSEPRSRADASVVRTRRCDATTSIFGPEQDPLSGAILPSRGKTTYSAISSPCAKKKLSL